MAKKRKTYTPNQKFQLVLEALQSEKQNAEIARSHGVHPISLANWKKKFLENGPQVFGGDQVLKEYEQKIASLERMLGQKEVEIALLKNFLKRN